MIKDAIVRSRNCAANGSLSLNPIRDRRTSAVACRSENVDWIQMHEGSLLRRRSRKSGRITPDKLASGKSVGVEPDREAGRCREVLAAIGHNGRSAPTPALGTARTWRDFTFAASARMAGVKPPTPSASASLARGKSVGAAAPGPRARDTTNRPYPYHRLSCAN